MGALNKNSATGTRTRVARVRAEYPNQLDYSGYEVLFFLPPNVVGLGQANVVEDTCQI